MPFVVVRLWHDWFIIPLIEITHVACIWPRRVWLIGDHFVPLADDDGATNGFLRLGPDSRNPWIKMYPASTLLILSDKVFSQIGVAWLNNDYFRLLRLWLWPGLGKRGVRPFPWWKYRPWQIIQLTPNCEALVMSSKSFNFLTSISMIRMGLAPERLRKKQTERLDLFEADFLVNLKIVIMIDDAFAVINDAVIVMSIRCDVRAKRRIGGTGSIEQQLFFSWVEESFVCLPYFFGRKMAAEGGWLRWFKKSILRTSVQ